MQQIVVGSLKSPSAEDIARLATLSVVSNHLCRSLDLESMGKVVLATLVRAFRADRGFLHLFQGSGEAGSRFDLDTTNGEEWREFQFTQTLLDNCLTSRAPVLVIDAEEAAQTHSVVATGIRSVMLCPLLIEERLLGVIYLDSLLRAGVFETNDCTLLQVIAEMVSVAVDRNQQAATVVRQSAELDVAEARLELAAQETILRLSRAAEFRDGETSEHLTRVSEYCEALGHRLGLPEEQVRAVKVASLLHDVGKLGIPDAILMKPGRFTDYERQVMQQHTVYGAQILSHSENPVIQTAAEIALNHHEKWDGSGYPSGLKKDEIPLSARIVAVADVFDAVSSARRYKESYSLDDSFGLLQKEAGSHFDPILVETFIAIRPKIEEIWNSNQEAPEEPAPASVEEPKPCLLRSAGDALAKLEALPVELARNSGLSEEQKSSVYQAVDFLLQGWGEPAREQLLELTGLVGSEKLSFHDATKLAGMVKGLKEFELRHSPSQSAAPRILLLDSDPYQREVLSTEATRRGMVVVECSEAEHAWRMFEEKNPDAVVMEIADPGVEIFLEKLKQAAPKIALLVFTRAGELSRRLSVLCFSHASFLHKPLPPAAVIDEVEEKLPSNQVESHPTVLAIDDDPVVLKVVERCLQKRGLRAYTTREPEHFWELLTEHTPDLVILDLEMPAVSGIELCQLLREDVKYRHLPILVLTGHEELAKYQEALEAGADDVLPKPLQESRLLSRIENRLARNRALHVSASRDTLTGLLHKRIALRAGEQLFASSLRQNLPFSVCLLEIEDFDKLVEREGWRYSVGVLREVAELLMRTSRAEDVVTRALDNSLLLMLINTDAQAVRHRLESLNTRLAQQKGPVAAVRCRGKFASTPGDGNDLRGLLERVGLSYAFAKRGQP